VTDRATRNGRPLRVVHCPVNIAGIPWQNTLALRRRGVDAQLVVFNRMTLHPDADVDLARPDGPFLRKQATQWAALARLLPRTDIRGKTPEQLAYGRRADAQVVGSYDAIRWVPEAHVIPPGLDLQALPEAPPSDRARPLVVHAPSNRGKKGTEHVIEACRALDVDLDIVEGLPNEEAKRRFAQADIIVDQLNAGWYGVFAIESMAMGKPVVTFLHEEARRRTEEAFGVQVPIVSASKDTLVDELRRLVALSPGERRAIGAASRAYALRVHDIESIADRLLDLYASL
jgi:glycosyltransferase involved in cell wall biosynthesis